MEPLPLSTTKKEELGKEFVELLHSWGIVNVQEIPEPATIPTEHQDIWLIKG